MGEQGSIDGIIINRMSENDRSETNSTDSHTNSKAGEIDRSETAVLEDMGEQRNIDRVIIDREDRIDENEVVAKNTENGTKSNHFGNTSKHDPSFDLPIALRKALTLPHYRKNIHIALECPKGKNVVMEEMKALEKKNTWEICALPKQKSVNLSRKWVFLGMKVARSKEGIFMSQRKYTLDLLNETGKLIYLSHTHPDISITARSVVDRKSTSDYCTVWGNLVTWRSKKQSVVARSSAEAKYRAMSLGISAISIANNLVQHDRTKHVEIDRHFIKKRLDSGSICISYIPSSRRVANVFTKGLLRPNFDFCVSKLGLIDIYVPT
ncbi:Cysteine-rich RLK (receptor-like protein kinase) 8 [Cucumis melo var. makuwa]|uniref:Cysteine-rich RLK (Receptor-like protein kinase) 8 n=1 Tax=Cucumis melo var. makuwa TaxID=1194695 RepID=A0A5A7SX01_CUCMM|nr:Cysteine-rich RLK (receptor-like protein kinase) 8 [Cucumis melo var. makuwa]TYK22347.1 Cysteine-rich RLK (receptor-like protein kinase) 8 [Cucumis melo var. makuwa]